MERVKRLQGIVETFVPQDICTNTSVSSYTYSSLSYTQQSRPSMVIAIFNSALLKTCEHLEQLAATIEVENVCWHKPANQ
ncbi:hypothetical protein OUZ56_031473 [Daphnia magna]|uniref:Uncharacterized protein n=1 Tax=Daphnia magna TaxID=35525 RepID=A0ABQ9ZUB6_9CRUS|nr:hypothetical protein OUZ56_031473 [Daphnia magna]